MFPDDRRNTVPANKYRPSNNNIQPLATLAQTEEEIDRIVALLDDKVEELRELTRSTTNLLGDWLCHRDKINMVLRANNERTSEDTRDSMARSGRNDEGVLGRELWLTWSLSDGDLKSLNTEIRVLQSQLSALQSKAKGIREVTGLG